jgi:hypothetical protein
LYRNDINHIEALWSVYLTGDFNSRVGVKHDFVIFYSINQSYDDESYVPDKCISRASLDKTCNSYGVKLIDLCRSTNIRLVNGRLYKNNNVGMYTYVSQNGASVIDYVLTNEKKFSNISYFCVQQVNEFSDHAPIEFSLHTKYRIPVQQEKVDINYKWDSNLTGYL